MRATSVSRGEKKARYRHDTVLFDLESRNLVAPGTSTFCARSQELKVNEKLAVPLNSGRAAPTPLTLLGAHAQAPIRKSVASLREFAPEAEDSIKVLSTYMRAV